MEQAKHDVLTERKLLLAFRRLTSEDQDIVLYVALALGEQVTTLAQSNVIPLFQDLL